ncbi:MAG: RNA pseudouridine synthase [Monoraphidium minutum]|nr:MAG: RNA pseudouridine synthase [Monoraphidium minutum]
MPPRPLAREGLPRAGRGAGGSSSPDVEEDRGLNNGAPPRRAAPRAQPKARLDAYLSSQLPDVSRAKIAASIKAGLVRVNGCAAAKPSATVRPGDGVDGGLLPPEPCTAEPETIPLDIVYEDSHLIVVNKAPGMVVHLSPGHSRGTLVNALLGHCGLPAMTVASGSARAGGGGLVAGGGGEGEDGDADGGGCCQPPVLGTAPATAAAAAPGVLRPGIVHRLDKGTSGLMVVAKDDLAHARLCEQFKARTVSRIYRSLALGVPAPAAGRVATNIARDPGDRLRMAAIGYGAARGRPAASNYRLLRRVGGGAAALVEWKLETGRTHQIRRALVAVHAKHLGHPLLGDDAYSPGNAAAARALAGRRTSLAPAVKAALDAFGRPALHALTLGFDHPLTGARLHFESQLPGDFSRLLEELEQLLGGGSGGGDGGGGGGGGGGPDGW